MINTFNLVQNQSKFNQGVPLTEPVNVGPGLNKGYTANPDGGFQQANTLDYAKMPNVDKLRLKSNPKISYEGRITSGFKSFINSFNKWC